MRLINWFKGLFKKSITVNTNTNSLVVLQNSKKKLNFGAVIDVPKDFVCVLCYKDKVADMFTEGRYRLDKKGMPLLTRIEKLTKQDKKGNLKKHFYADIYFVNLKEFVDQQFYSFNSIYIKDKHYKSVNAYLSGKFSYVISSPVDFLEGMFTSFGVVRDGIAKNEISNWVADIATKIVQKKKPTVEKLYSRDTSCFENMVEGLNKELFDVGVKILSFEITNVKFPKKIYKKITLDYEELHQKEQKVYIGEQIDLINPVKTASQKSFENQSNEVYLQEAQNVQKEMQTKVLSTDSDGDSIVNTGVMPEYKPQYNSTYNNEDIEQNYDNTEEQESALINQQQYEAPIQKTLEYKRCPNCGAYNSKSAETCFCCGHKFNQNN